jgi:fructosamine-3-kinase
VSLEDAIGEAAGARVTGSRRVSGGSINDALQVELADGRTAFVKTRPDPRPGEYAAEAASLAWLAEPGAVRLPAVIAVGETFLAIDWIDAGGLDEAGAEALGRGLAALHGAGAPAFGAFHDGPAELHVGPLGFDATPAREWPAFYAERLVRPLIAQARDRGSLSQGGADAVGRVCDRMADLAGPPEPAARLHGDLWGGNVLGGADGGAWLVDPIAYGGHREVDLAMLRLFGAPSPRVFAAYQEAAPLADGHEDRLSLYQLLPLMIHAVLFGGGYGASAEDAARRYVG